MIVVEHEDAEDDGRLRHPDEVLTDIERQAVHRPVRQAPPRPAEVQVQGRAAVDRGLSRGAEIRAWANEQRTGAGDQVCEVSRPALCGPCSSPSDRAADY